MYVRSSMREHTVAIHVALDVRTGPLWLNVVGRSVVHILLLPSQGVARGEGVVVEPRRQRSGGKARGGEEEQEENA